MNNTEALTERLRAVIPWGSSTCSKAAVYMPDEPGVIVRGKGCRVWDADGREFIDYRNALGPITLGYCYPAVDDAICNQLKNGIIFGHPHPLEGEVAEMFRDLIPCAEKVRFLKTGGEALAACIRLARHHTGRDHVVQIGYNGWLNSLASGGQILPGSTAAASPPGVPAALSELHHSFRWNDMEGLDSIFKKSGNSIAALVVAADYAGLSQGKTFYPFLRELTHRYGTVLIYDEIVTGFRLAIGGVQEYFGVTPDLAVFGKGVANGMPISVYCGRAEIMDKLKTAVVTSTHGGETLSLAAAKAVITTYRTENVVKHFWEKGELLWKGVNALFLKHRMPVEITGCWPCPMIRFAPDAPRDFASRFYRSAYRSGVSLYSVSYVNFSHQDKDITETIERLAEGIRNL